MSSRSQHHPVVVDIDYFDPRSMKKNCIVFIIGKRGSGKSTVAEHIMSYHTDIKEGICISKTDKMNEFWTQHLPPLFIHHKYSPSITYKLLDHQEAKWKKHKAECRRRGEKPDLKDIEPAFAIYDDITYDKSFLKDKATRELFMNGRHYGILIVITCQYLMDIGPDLRGQIDYVITLKDNIKNNRHKLYEYFAGVFPTFASFDKTFVTCTDNREALVIFNGSLEHDIRKCVFFYLATPDVPYKLGSEEFWKYSDEHYAGNSSGDEEDAQYAGMSKRDREKASSFEVRKQYPGKPPGQDSDDDDDPSIDMFSPVPFKPTPKGAYGTQYRSKKLLANQCRTKKKSNDQPSYFVPPQAVQQQAPHPIQDAPLISLPVAKKTRSKSKLRKKVQFSVQPQSNLRSTNTKRKKKKKELKTEIKSKFAPYEAYGKDILKKIDQEPERIRRQEHKKRKVKAKKERALKKIREKEERRKREEMEDQLFLY